MFYRPPSIRAVRCATTALLLAASAEALRQLAWLGFSAGQSHHAASWIYASVLFLLTSTLLCEGKSSRDSLIEETNFSKAAQDNLLEIASTDHRERLKHWPSTHESALRNPVPELAKIQTSGGVSEEQQKKDVLGIAVDIRKLKQAEDSLLESERQYRLLVSTIPEVVWRTDANGNVIFVSPQVETLLGYSPDEFRQQGDSLWFNSVHRDDQERVRQAFESLVKDGRPYDIECRARKKSGEWFWAHDRAVATDDSYGFRIATGIISDITERKQDEECLLFKTALLEAQAEATIDGILAVDESDRIVLANKQFGLSFGIPDEMLRTQDNLIVLKHVTAQVEDPDAFVARIDYLNGHRDEKSRDELRFKDGKIFDRYSAPLVDLKGQYRGRIWYFRDITDHKIAEGRIQYLAYYDALTGLPNRILLKDRIKTALADARRQKYKLALLFLDLDRFKDINDSLGHPVGDLLLQALAERLKKWQREQDTVARLGGDEFLVMITHIQDESDAAVAAQRLMDVMSADFIIQDHQLSIDCSVGISVFPDHGEDGETLIKHADSAMYYAKQNGHNTIKFFTADINAQVEERLTLEHSLRLAIEKEELFLMYQPQMDVATGRVTGLEALLRWQHPDLGVVPPDKFIRIAENSGLIVPIGEWVLRTACRQARKWHDEGLPRVSLAVNVSAVQFRQEDFCELIKEALRDTGLAPEFLELELTESLLLANEEVTLSVIRELKAMGLTLAIDDFGTGYSNFSYLKRFRVDKLKIDCSFIRDLDLNPDDAAITCAIISMAKSLRLKVLAESVETEAQMSFLRAQRCDQIQGYYFSKPLAVEDVADKLRSTAMNALAYTPRNAIMKTYVPDDRD
jgi:diguanylate cyclase (GGDEF)-like protein/PAS domain S-box-containing protein